MNPTGRGFRDRTPHHPSFTSVSLVVLARVRAQSFDVPIYSSWNQLVSELAAASLLLACSVSCSHFAALAVLSAIPLSVLAFPSYKSVC